MLLSLRTILISVGTDEGSRGFGLEWRTICEWFSIKSGFARIDMLRGLLTAAALIGCNLRDLFARNCTVLLEKSLDIVHVRW